MRRIIVATFTSLDGVMQAPGGPGKTRPAASRWAAGPRRISTQRSARPWARSSRRPFDLLLGRKTYDIFAAHWPYVSDPNDPIAGLFNRVTKYVASRSQPEAELAEQPMAGPGHRRIVADAEGRRWP